VGKKGWDALLSHFFWGAFAAAWKILSHKGRRAEGKGRFLRAGNGTVETTREKVENRFQFFTKGGSYIV
jgi:hypothetical protein